MSSKKKNKKVYENLQASEPVNQLEAALLQLPKWTSKDAKTIAEQFSYEQLAYAKETDLLKIKGIGNKKVQTLSETLDMSFEVQSPSKRRKLETEK